MNSSRLPVQLLQQFMVLSGHTIQRFFPRAVLTLLSLVSLNFMRGQTSDVAGTMPEDYLPELKPILAAALRRSPELITKEFERLVTEARLYGANAPRLPHAGGYFSYANTESGVSGADGDRTRRDGFFYGLSVSQALFHWGALKNQSDAAQLNVLIAEKNTALAYRQISTTLRKAYLSLIVEKARLRQARESLRLFREEVGRMAARREEGAVSADALEGEQLRLREQSLDVQRAEAEFAMNRKRFARLAGLEELPEDAVPGEIPRPSYSEPLATALTAAVLRDNAQSTLEFEIYDLRVREAMLREKIEKVRLLPKFSINAGYTLRNEPTIVGNAVEQRGIAERTIGVGGNWAIFDGLATRGAKREARLARRTLEHRRAAEIEQLLENVQHLDRNLEFDAEQLELAEIHRQRAIDARNRAAEEAELGRVRKSDIARADLGVLGAEAHALTSRATFLGRWSEFVALAAGDPVLKNLPARHARE